MLLLTRLDVSRKVVDFIAEITAPTAEHTSGIKQTNKAVAMME